MTLEPSLLPLAISFSGIAQGLLLVLFVLSSLLLMVVILLQEGKGGGLAGAFGGAAAETFGVKAGTVNRFTAYLGAAFIGIALLHAGVSSYRHASVIPVEPTRPSTTHEPAREEGLVVPPDQGPGGGAGGGAPPAPPTQAPGAPGAPGGGPPPAPPAAPGAPPPAPPAEPAPAPAPMDGGG